jgi:hypothetical protein
VAVDEQAPDLLEGHHPHEVLDVHAAVAKCAAFSVGLGDLGLESDDALEPRGNLYQSGFHAAQNRDSVAGEAGAGGI